MSATAAEMAEESAAGVWPVKAASVPRLTGVCSVATKRALASDVARLAFKQQPTSSFRQQLTSLEGQRTVAVGEGEPKVVPVAQGLTSTSCVRGVVKETDRYSPLLCEPPPALLYVALPQAILDTFRPLMLA